MLTTSRNNKLREIQSRKVWNLYKAITPIVSNTQIDKIMSPKTKFPKISSSFENSIGTVISQYKYIPANTITGKAISQL